MTKLQPVLRKLKERFVELKKLKSPQDKEPHKVVCCYVDNCCNVRNKLVEVFPGILVKLDSFHWLQRWNILICEPTSVEGGVVRVLFSRALFAVSPYEFDRAKAELLARWDRQPTTKEV